ncbi:MAG: hypothetical protein JXM75_10720 [Chromatiaceae bacterium]|nr:hypothetical protein [Chromatiaceae bacterium]
MEHRPQIRTAIPRRRYRLDRHDITLLGEIDSGDTRQWRYLLAFVPEGQPEPALFVGAEAVPPAERDQGAWRLRVIGELLEDELGCDDRWGELDAFAEQALSIGARILGLDPARAERLI